MIIRVFRSQIRPDKFGEFEENLRAHSIPTMDAQNVPYYFGRPMAPGDSEYVVVSIWPDLDSLQRFAGDTLQPVIPFEERSMFESFSVQHYEVMAASERET